MQCPGTVSWSSSPALTAAKPCSGVVFLDPPHTPPVMRPNYALMTLSIHRVQSALASSKQSTERAGQRQGMRGCSWLLRQTVVSHGFTLRMRCFCVMTNVSFLRICSIIEIKINMSRGRGGDGVKCWRGGAGTASCHYGAISAESGQGGGENYPPCRPLTSSWHSEYWQPCNLTYLHHLKALINVKHY